MVNARVAFRDHDSFFLFVVTDYPFSVNKSVGTDYIKYQFLDLYECLITQLSLSLPFGHYLDIQGVGHYLDIQGVILFYM